MEWVSAEAMGGAETVAAMAAAVQMVAVVKVAAVKAEVELPRVAMAVTGWAVEETTAVAKEGAGGQEVAG